MAKRKSLLGGLIKLILSLVLIVAIILAIGYFYVKSAYGVDAIEMIGYIKTLNTQVDETQLIDNAFGDADYVSLQSEINTKMNAQIITKDANDKYVITDDYSSMTSLLVGNIELTGKECAALASIFIASNADMQKFDIAGQSLSAELKQIKFSNATDGDVDMNVIFKIDLSDITKNMTSFPLSLLKNYIPQSVYASVTVNIDKTGTFAYTVTHKSLQLSNLKADEVEKVFTAINKFTELKLSDLTEKIGNLVANALIGNANNTSGMAYTLGSTTPVALANDYTFDSDNKFVILANTQV